MSYAKSVTMLVLAVSTAVTVTGCRDRDIAEMSEDDLRSFLRPKEETFEEICIQMGSAVWNLYTGEGQADQAIPKRRFRDLFADDSLQVVIEHFSSRTGELEDAALRRRVEIWDNILTAAAINYEDDISELQNELETWLAAEDSTPGRPSAEELDSMALELMKLRNERARELGFGNYPEMVFEVTEIGADWIEEWLGEMENRTRAPYGSLVDQMTEESGKDSFDYDDARTLAVRYIRAVSNTGVEGESFSSLMRETVENIGISYDDLPLRFVEKELPSGIGGQGFAISIPEDFRTVVLPKLPLTDRMHELGHGLQWIFTRAESPILEGYEWCLGNECPAWSEGMAETMANFTRNEEWLKKYSGMTATELKERSETIEKYAPAAIRFSMIMFLMERELYRDPEREVTEILRSVYRDYLFIEDEPSMNLPLANMVYVSYPLYVQNYVLADIVAWQIHDTIEKRFGAGYAFDAEVGPWLARNCWEQGELFHWQEKLRRATGRELDVDGYLGSLGM